MGKFNRNKRVKRGASLALVLALFLSFCAFPIGSVYAGSKSTYLCPGGMSFGLEIETDGVIVVGYAEVNNGNKSISPAEKAGIKIKDVIVSLGGKEVESAEEISEIAKKSGGTPLLAEIIRDGEKISLSVYPQKDSSDGEYRIGLLLRDSTAGIGTVTYIDPESKSFAGLGHGICDADTGLLLPLKSGEVYRAVVSSVRMGKSGTPGELHGYFEKKVSGSLLRNTEQGVFGKIDTDSFGLSAPIEIASIDEVREGEALIYSTVSSDGVGVYTIRINAINKKSDTKNFSIEVIDKDLMSKTGGIVQGMSGSPIIQNGKLVGAVTHVTVNDPTKGYGIFIENMLNAAEMPQARAS